VDAGADPFASAYAKLRWAESRHAEMQETFAAFALPKDPDARPYGIRFHAPAKPRGLVVATFIVEKPMPEEMSLLAADLVHNTRVALDHTLARLKERFGGEPGRGSFPICATEGDWTRRVAEAGRRSPLHGLAEAAVDLIRTAQPMSGEEPGDDPLVVLNALDNDDKHRLLHTSFVYPGGSEGRGLDLIDVVQPSRVRASTNEWTAGEPLEDGTTLATFMVRDPEEGILSPRDDAPIGFAVGHLDAGRVEFSAMIDRVRGIADVAGALVDRGG
jgi:hypothetical protein